MPPDVALLLPDPGDGGLPVLKPLEPLELVELLEPVELLELVELCELGVLDGAAGCGRDAPGVRAVDVESAPPA